MKTKYFFNVLALAVLAAGCKPSNANYTVDTNPVSTTQPVESLDSRATNAWQEVKSATTNAWQNVKAGSTNAWASVKEKTADAWADWADWTDGTNDYTYDQKDAFAAKARAEMDKLDAKIKELSDRTTNAAANFKADAQVKIQHLREQRSSLDPKMAAIKNSTDADWNQVKAGFQDSYEATKQSVKDAWHWLNDKLSSQ